MKYIKAHEYARTHYYTSEEAYGEQEATVRNEAGGAEWFRMIDRHGSLYIFYNRCTKRATRLEKMIAEVK